MSGRPTGSGLGSLSGLDGAHQVVAEIADRAAGEGRQVRQRRLAVAAGLVLGQGVRVARVAQRPAHHLAGVHADEAVAPDPLALLGGLQQEGGRAIRGVGGAAQLQEGRDGRLEVVDEAVAQRDQVVRAGHRPHVGERRLDAQGTRIGGVAQDRLSSRMRSASPRVRRGCAAARSGDRAGRPPRCRRGRRSPHGRHGDLLGLLHLLADQRRIVEQFDGVGAGGALGAALHQRALQAGKRLCGAGGSSSPSKKQVRSPV